jgi:hypothetical protein
MDTTELAVLFDRHGDRFRPEPARLRGAAGGTATWDDLGDMLEAWIRHHPDEPAHTIAYTVSDRDTVTEVSLKVDQFTVWRWPGDNPATDGAASAGPAAPASLRPGRGARGRPTLGGTDIVAVAAELALANGPDWVALGPRRPYGKGYVQRRLGLSVDQVRTRMTRAERLMATDPDFPAVVADAVDERRWAVAAEIAAIMATDGLPFDLAAGRSSLGIPGGAVDGLSEATDTLVAETDDVARQLVELLGGTLKATRLAVATWRRDNPQVDVADLVESAGAHAAEVAAGNTRRLTAPTWLAHNARDTGAA